MGRSKLKRYSENAESPFVLEPGKEVFDKIKSKWRSLYFENDKPIVLELACGRAEYTIGMAKMYPDMNFIGVDIKGSRLWKGSNETKRFNLNNTAFLRAQIQNIEDFFSQNEVDEIWITFPDPRPKSRDEKRRLTSKAFIDKYKRILKPGGFLHLKTDNSDLFDFSLNQLHKEKGKVIHATKDLYNSVLYKDELTIQTTYEEKFGDQGFRINYLKYRLD